MERLNSEKLEHFQLLQKDPREKRIKSGKYIKDKNLQAVGETYE